MQEKIVLKGQLAQELTLFERLKRIILAVQHLIAMFGATVLVPILTGLDPSVAIFSAGLGTMIFHLCTKKKVPVFLGSSFAFIPGIIAVKQSFGDLRYAQGGIVVAGLIYVLVSLVVQRIGVERIKRFLPAQVVGPMIMVIGLNLVPVAYNSAKTNYLVSIATLLVAVMVTLFGKGLLKQLSIIVGVAFGYILSAALGIVDTSSISAAKLIEIPHFTLPKFDLAAIAIIAPVVLAVFMEHIGDITTNGQVVGQDFIKDPGLNRTLLGDGLATMAAGFIGGPANTTYGENTGVLAITKNYDPSILRMTAVFAMILGFIGKVGGVLKSIPVPVMGGISFMLYSMIALIGVQTIKNSKVKFNVKNIIVMATVLILGLLPSYTGINIGIPVTETVKIQGLSFAAIVGVIVNLVLNRE
ncbi:uracil-xanthine permease family protein [Caloramator sp. CAR-1]|uniref:uracil-xanthine permease family protein n=1 Tax=Caloramator sp. CAR-1 TaxID=3062777 RepID=UPI0026E2136D|nr:uracil-xanthine permease family protein [Caloramator sp. CAR-1]MDO6354919.1 uracil-xanthine permease family protein [Caloramator sp. CAR-1]